MRIIIATLLLLLVQQVNAMAVFDAANLGQAIQQVQTATQQLQQMKEQFNVLQQQYQSISGIRNMGDILNNPQLMKYLPDDYRSILQNGYATAQDIRNGSLGNSSSMTASQALDKNGMQLATNQAIAEEGYKQAAQRFDDIQVLLDKIQQAPDQKSILDLQARIQAEQAMLQNEANRIALLQHLAQAQKDLAQQEQIERRIKNRHLAPKIPSNW